MLRNNLIIIFVALMAFSVGCQKRDGIDDDLSFLKNVPSLNQSGIFDISNDNSGKVTITPTGEGASSFTINFGGGAGNASEVVLPGHNITHVYPEGSYTVTIVSKSLSGEELTTTHPLEVTFRAPENIAVNIGQSAHTITVEASALYAASFMVYFGDVAGEQGTPLAADGQIVHTYASAGEYQVKVVALSGGAAKSESITPVMIYDPFALPITYDESTVSYFFGTFGDNQQFATVANPDPSGINTTAMVGQFTRGLQGWSGTYSPLDNAIDMADGSKILVWAYNPDPAMIGKRLNVELENGSSIDNGVAVLKVPLTKSGEWEELVFDFGSISGIPAGETFKQLVLRFNDEYEGTGAGGQGTVVYVDNFRLTN